MLKSKEQLNLQAPYHMGREAVGTRNTGTAKDSDIPSAYTIHVIRGNAQSHCTSGRGEDTVKGGVSQVAAESGFQPSFLLTFLWEIWGHWLVLSPNFTHWTGKTALEEVRCPAKTSFAILWPLVRMTHNSEPAGVGENTQVGGWEMWGAGAPNPGLGRARSWEVLRKQNS